MNKTILYQLLALLLLFGITTTSNAQVTIGAGTPPSVFSVLELSTASTKGGLRLPHLTTSERDALNFVNLPSGTPEEIATKAQAVGLSIYNTTTKCVEYWNATKWVSLCTGNADISFTDDSGNDVDPTTDFDEAGEEKGPFLPKEEPLCTGTRPPYSYVAITGADFIQIDVIDESTSKFNVRMNENPTARSRNAIVRVTNNCTGEYREFLFGQKANDGDCNAAIAKPNIGYSNNLQLCKDGAVFLWITNIDPAASYIWTLNEVEQGRGASYTATRSGRYVVYVNAIGCPDNNSEQLVVINNSSTAPEPTKIRANNGAVICGSPATAVQLTAVYAGTATDVKWYKDGVATGSPGLTLSVSAVGDYFAVIDQGGCNSRASNTISVGANSTGTSIIGFDPTTVFVNNQALSETPVFCQDGLLNLKVVPADNSLTYTWKINDVEIGKGAALEHQLSSSATGELYLEVIASMAGDAFTCPTSVDFKKTIREESLPNATIGGDPQFCGGKTAQLNTGAGGLSYLWRNLSTNGTSITTTNSYQADTPGDYKVEITTSGGCVAVSPSAYTVDRWGVPVLQWGTAVSKVGENVEFPLSVYNTSTTATGYTWAIDPVANGTIVSENLNDAILTMTDDATIKVYATNLCGNGPLLTLPIVVEKARPNKPVLNISSGAYCGGFTYNVTNMADYGPTVTFSWSVTGGTATLKQMGDKKESCYVEFTGSGNVTISVTANEALASLPTTGTVNGALKTNNSYTLNGTWCYDVKLTDYAPATEWGIWAHRTKETFGQPKIYKLMGSPMPTASNITWMVKDPHSAIETGGFVPSTTNPGELSIKFRENLPLQLKGNKIGIDVKIEVAWTITDGGCTSTYYDEKIITIKDADCCTGVSDSEGNYYNAARFGDAGCWMTQNLRSKKSPSKTLVLTTDYRIPGGNDATAIAKNYGYHYTWAATVDFSTTGYETVATGAAGKTPSTFRGICPEGWVLPSDFDYNQLEKEIATNPSEYSATTTPTTWLESYETATGWRQNTATGWGQNMKSITQVNNQVTGGKSNASNNRGFDALLVGDGGSIGTLTYFWSSSMGTATNAWNRVLNGSSTGVRRTQAGKTNQFSVRCKKKD